MAVETTYVLQNLSGGTPASTFRQAVAGVVNDGGGVLPGTVAASYVGSRPVDLTTTQQATPNMSVLIAPGQAFIPGTQVSAPTGYSWSPQGMYYLLNDANVTLTISASNPTNPRIDTVYAAVQDSFYSGATDLGLLGVVTGTPAGTPVAPAAPSNAIVIAYVAVAANATSIVNANISDKRIFTSASGGIAVAAAAAQYPPNPTVGQYVDDATLGLLRYTGSAWAPTQTVTYSGSALAGTFSALKPVRVFIARLNSTTDTNGLLTASVPSGATAVLTATANIDTNTTTTRIANCRYDLTTLSLATWQMHNVVDGSTLVSTAFIATCRIEYQ